MLDVQVAPTCPAHSEGRAGAELQLRSMVIGSVTSTYSKRNYAKALDLLFAFAGGRPLSRALLIEYRASMDKLAPSTVNVRLAVVKKLVESGQAQVLDTILDGNLGISFLREYDVTLDLASKSVWVTSAVQPLGK